MKNFIKLLIALHMGFVSLACINGLSQVLTKDGQSINKYGASVLKLIDVEIYDTKLYEALKVYGFCTGTFRGYSFFSPNLSRMDKNFYFLSDGNLLIEPKMKYFETSFKYKAFESGLFQDIFSTKDRDDYLKSLGAHLMSNHSSDCIDVYMTYDLYNDISDAKEDDVMCSTEDIHLFTLRKKT